MFKQVSEVEYNREYQNVIWQLIQNLPQVFQLLGYLSNIKTSNFS